MPAPGAEHSAEVAAAVHAPAPAGNVRRRVKQALKAAYILGAAVLSVWVVSFTPVEGPPIWPYIPGDSGAVVQVRSGADLWRTLSGNRAFLEALNDPDVNALFGLLAQRDQALDRLRHAPAVAQALVAATPEALFPFVGRECAVACLAPPPSQDALAANDTAASGTHARPATPVLVFTRLSGSPGQLVRMAAPFIKLPRHLRFFDLGGDLVALGINGAQPADPPLPFPAEETAHRDAPLARVVISPANLAAERSAPPTPAWQYEQLRQEGLPEPVLQALRQPPTFLEMMNMTPAPARISLDLYPTAEGGFTVSGRVPGSGDTFNSEHVPGAAAGTQARDNVFAEALLPVNMRACFLRYLVAQMPPSKNPALLARGQRRWSRRFSELGSRGVDLDRDLWPAFGRALRFTMEDDKLDPAGYAVASASVAFAKDIALARTAAEELTRERWSGDVFDGAIPSHAKPPYVKLVKEAAFDRYLLNTGQLAVPSWVIAPHVFAFTTNVGPYALRDPSALPRPSAPAGAGTALTSYFLWADGPRLAPTVERLATAHYDTLEEELGPRDFLAQCPDAPVRIRLARKLAGLLGRFRLEVRPHAGADTTTIHISWTPGTMAVPAQGQTDAAPPPPPGGN